MDVNVAVAPRWPDLRSRMRGFLVGYALGDAAARTHDVGTGPLKVGPSGTLALATCEGVIRGLVREQLKGISGGIPGCCWHSMARWAERSDRGHLAGVAHWTDMVMPGRRWPDGWLSQIPVLRGSRGSAPAIEAALSVDSPQPGPTPADGAGSTGNLIIARVLPLAMLVATSTPPDEAPGHARADDEFARRLVTTAADTAAYSHGVLAQVVAVALTRTAAEVLATGKLTSLIDIDMVCDVFYERGGTSDVSRAHEALRAINDAIGAGMSRTLVFGPRTALRATETGMVQAQALCDPDHIDGALEAVARLRDPAGAAVTMALLGAVHGFESLPAGAVARLDVAHVADQLAQDLTTQCGSSLSSDRGTPPEHWVNRYPGY